MKSERVPTRATTNTKKRYGNHRVGAVPLTFWVDKEFKEFLKDRAAEVELPKWSLSDHMDYIIRDFYDLWDKEYRPNLKRRK